jgi:hypothetical protein
MGTQDSYGRQNGYGEGRYGGFLLNLSQRPARHFIEQILLPEFRSVEARGFEVSGVSPGDESFLPVATTIDNVGAVFPSLIISFSNETSGGETTYDFLTSKGPGQRRQGTLVATARAEVRDGYTGDADAFAPIPARDLVVQITDAVENVCQRRATGLGSEFETIGSQRAAEAPDDRDADPTVRMANVEVRYSFSRRP